MKNKKTIKQEEVLDVENAINSLKKKKEEQGLIPADSKKIKIINGYKDFSGKTLKIQKSVFKNGNMFSYSAGTKWEELDSFAKKNIHFNESDFV